MNEKHKQLQNTCWYPKNQTAWSCLRFIWYFETVKFWVTCRDSYISISASCLRVVWTGSILNLCCMLALHRSWSQTLIFLSACYLDYFLLGHLSLWHVSNVLCFRSTKCENTISNLTTFRIIINFFFWSKNMRRRIFIWPSTQSM